MFANAKNFSFYCQAVSSLAEVRRNIENFFRENDILFSIVLIKINIYIR